MLHASCIGVRIYVLLLVDHDILLKNIWKGKPAGVCTGNAERKAVTMKICAVGSWCKTSQFVDLTEDCCLCIWYSAYHIEYEANRFIIIMNIARTLTVDSLWSINKLCFLPETQSNYLDIGSVASYGLGAAITNFRSESSDWATWSPKTPFTRMHNGL